LEGHNTLLGDTIFYFIIFLKQSFLGTRNFGEAQKKFGEHCPRMPPVATGLTSDLMYILIEISDV